MLKFSIGDMVTVDKFSVGHELYGPWKIVTRQYTDGERRDIQQEYQCSLKSNLRWFNAAALTLARKAVGDGGK